MADPTAWETHREETAFVFYDHSPVWLKITGDQKLLFSEQDTTSWGSRKKRQRRSEGADASETNVGVAQTRGQAEKAADKYRLTLIHFQAIENYFSQSLDPVGRVLPGI